MSNKNLRIKAQKEHHNVNIDATGTHRNEAFYFSKHFLWNKKPMQLACMHAREHTCTLQVATA